MRIGAFAARGKVIIALATRVVSNSIAAMKFLCGAIYYNPETKSRLARRGQEAAARALPTRARLRKTCDSPAAYDAYTYNVCTQLDGTM